MPYWGANVKNDNYVVQAKIHGESTYPCPDDLIEFLSNLAKNTKVEARIDEYALAKFYAEKVAAAFTELPYAKWVTVDILTNEGKTYGHTALIEEKVHEFTRVRALSG